MTACVIPSLLFRGGKDNWKKIYLMHVTAPRKDLKKNCLETVQYSYSSLFCFPKRIIVKM